ncbi:TPA: hypothetical protein UL935_000294 [Stenotrophomonas maltophilia]|nr:hypothetical protein [Stenotrophomonas maltophilia]
MKNLVGKLMIFVASAGPLLQGLLWLAKRKNIALCCVSLGLVAGCMTANAGPASAGSGEGKRRTGTTAGASLVAGVDGHVLPLDGVPVAFRSSHSEAYRHLRQCHTRRQFEAFVANSKADPESLQSRPEKILQLDPDARARYLDRLAMLEDRRQECVEWERNVPLDTAYKQLYVTALESALAGDQTAASCFVVKTWPMPSQSSPEYRRVASLYVENGKWLIDTGLLSGSWPMVRATAAALVPNHAVEPLLPIDSRAGYQISRLMQLGSRDHALSQTYAYDAAQFAANIGSPVELQRLDKEARELFQTKFRSSYAEMTSFTTLCD